MRLLLFFFVLCSASLGAASYAHAGVLTKAPNNLGLVGYWSFEDGKGATVTDFSGKGNRGTMTNMDPATDWVTGRVGKALDFDGTDDYVAIGGSSSIYSMTTDLSVFAWIRTTDTSWEAFSGGESDDGGWGLASFSSIGGTGQLTPSIGNVWRTSGHTAINDGQWHHVGYTLSSASGGTLQFYLDGAPDGSAITSAGAHNGSGSGIRMGSDSLSQFELDGELDEARIYNRALSSAEVAALYAITNRSVAKPRYNDGLVFYAPLDDGEGTTARNYGSSGVRGVMTDFALTGSTSNWVSGQRNGALNFDGTNDFVNFGNHSSLYLRSNLSIFTWIKTSTPYKSVISWGSGGTGGVANGQYGIGTFGALCGGAGRLTAYISGVWRCGGTSVTDGNWHHVGYTLASNGDLQFYFDGATDGAVISTGSQFSAGANNNLVFGDDSSAGSVFAYNGSLDEVRIYNRVLSTAEVAELYADTGHRKRKLSTSSEGSIGSTNLVAWHTFDGAHLNTTTSTDRSASGNHGTLGNGPLPRVGKVGQALRFDGSDDRVVTKQNPSGLGYGTGDFSWFAWIYPERVNDSYEMIWAQGSSGIPYLAVRDNILHFYLSTTYETSAGYITANTWQHVGIVRSAGTLTLYKNGVAYSSTSSQPGSISAPDYAYISSYGSGGAHAFKGAIDDLRIYNKALSSDEVLLLYRLTGGPSVSQAPPDTTAPVISSVVAGVGDPCGQAENISWTTNEAADTQIEYGTTVSYGSSSSLDSSLVTSHFATATGLNFSTTYYYRVRSADVAGNIAYSTGSFATPSALACGGGP